MHILDVFIPLTWPAALEDTLVLLGFMAFGMFAYAKQLGAGGLAAAILVLTIISSRFLPPNMDVIVGLGLVGMVLGVNVGIAVFVPKVTPKTSSFRYPPPPHFNYGPQSSQTFSGFEDVENDDFADQSDASASSSHEEFAGSQPAGTPPSKDYHAVLGVSRGAQPAELKAAYHKLMKTCHPDLFPGDKEKEARSKEISEAYQALTS
ncbi:MAG TPA: J domain-containing protein [Planktothrix sp.]|jgi:hypothetical protein